MEKRLIDGHYRVVFTEEDKLNIVNWFVNDGYSMRKITKIFGLARSGQVAKILDDYGIDHSRGNTSSYKYNFPEGIYDENYENKVIEEIANVPEKTAKYNINQHYFDDLRNPEVIYVIGFLYADGCNHECQSIALSLEEQDSYILELINRKMDNEKQVRFIDYSNKHDFGYSYKNQYCLNIYNSRIAKVLNILGVTPRKSLTLEFPKWLHPSLYPVFINGVFDGDGSLYRYKNEDGKPRNTVLTITSTENFCKALTDIAAKYIGINSHIYDASCHNGITRVFQICGSEICKKFLDWMYSMKTIYLQRKYNRYCDYYNLDKSIVA